MNKTKVMSNGSKAGQITGPVDIQWINDELKLLGITFRSNSAILQGKVLILNTLGLSGLVYLGSVHLHPIPFPCFQTINKLNSVSCGQEKRDDKPCHSVSSQEQRGGLGITDLDIKLPALQLKRMQCILSPFPEAKWIFLPRYWIGRKLSKVRPMWSF